MRDNTFWPAVNLLWDRVYKNENGCWVWLKMDGTPATSEPRLQYHNQQIRPRRWVWTIVRRHEPIGLLHTECGNVACVNPDHHTERTPVKKCGRGHVMGGENLWLSPTNKKRDCKICRNLRNSTPEQKLKAKKRSQIWIEANREAERLRHRAIKRRHALLKQITQDTLHWSPSLDRWLFWDGNRWVGVGYDKGELGAAELLTKILRTAGVLPETEMKARRYVHSSLTMLRNQSRSATTEEAA